MIWFDLTNVSNQHDQTDFVVSGEKIHHLDYKVKHNGNNA